jgi:carboxypeptidase family protein
MANQRRVSRVWLALIQQGFQPSHGSIEEKGFDSVGHILFYHRGHRGTRRALPGLLDFQSKRRPMLTTLHCVLLVLFMAAASAGDCSTSKEFTLNHRQKLSGVLVDPNGADLPGIEVQLLTSKKIAQVLTTNSQGAYDFGEVPTGKYRISIQYSDHAFCAPQIQCNSKQCQILPKLRINPKQAVIVR